MQSQNFINLRTHTNYSLSEGMLTSNYIADFCVNDMQPACAITDTSNLFGAFEFSEKLFCLTFRFAYCFYSSFCYFANDCIGNSKSSQYPIPRR